MDFEISAGSSGLFSGLIESHRDPDTGFFPKGVLVRALSAMFNALPGRFSAALIEIANPAHGPAKTFAEVVSPAAINDVVSPCGGAVFVMDSDRILLVFPGHRPEEVFLAVEALRSVASAGLSTGSGGFSAGIGSMTGREALKTVARGAGNKLIRQAEEALAAVLAEGAGRTGIYTRRRMILKPVYYPSSSLVRLSRLAKRFCRTESSILREALTDLFDKYGDGESIKGPGGALLRIRAGFEAFAGELVRGFEEAAARTGQASMKGHSGRVSSLAVAVGRSLGLEDQKLRDLALVAAVHDIGKIHGATFQAGGGSTEPGGRPKPDRHPGTGAALLALTGFLQAPAAAVASHHERMDGSGFPDGLSGGKIPLQARIIGACDRLDHLVFPGGIIENALETMKWEAGAWDPAVLEALEATVLSGYFDPLPVIKAGQ